MSSPPASSLDIAFSYTVSSSGGLITDIHLIFNGSQTGSGTTTVVETVLDPVTLAVIGQAQVTNPPPSFDQTIVLSEQLSTVLIQKDITLTSSTTGCTTTTAGSCGTANISIVDQLVSQTVPEPATLLLVGSGLLASGLLGRRRFFSKKGIAL